MNKLKWFWSFLDSNFKIMVKENVFKHLDCISTLFYLELVTKLKNTFLSIFLVTLSVNEYFCLPFPGRRSGHLWKTGE
jgi:hypothetical protein